MSTEELSDISRLFADTVVPPYVPPELVRPFPYGLGAKTKEQPHSFIADIHKGPPIFWVRHSSSTPMGGWVPRRMEDIRNIYYDNDHFSASGLSGFAMMIGETWVNVPSELDPPHHTLIRSAINPLFTPKKMAALEDSVRQHTRNSISLFKDKGSCELMSDFAFEFPIRIFLELMGLPQSDMKQFLIWEHDLLHSMSLAGIMGTLRSVSDYLRSEIEARRKAPREDFISYGLNVEVDGRRFTDDEIMGFCFNLFVGGLDTVSTNIGHQFRHLAERPDHQNLLRNDPQRIPGAIEEMMRAYAAVATGRRCIKEVTIGGVTMQPGDSVAMATFLAGRDPEAFENPEVVDFDRKPRHVSFGYGVHTCIGMHLAKREMRVALEEFLAAIPEFGITPGVEVESYLGGMIAPIALPLSW
ncbi:cytochrome P450 [Sphingomonas bacterium]|uniref:cytochrome P450 n=1 Tax=Sphingomonas bacterium TaxID=1895847 RepID=UPI0020C6AB5F|nr:cytochrome P450 [Sphingomonas bacterium]